MDCLGSARYSPRELFGVRYHVSRRLVALVLDRPAIIDVHVFISYVLTCISDTAMVCMSTMPCSRLTDLEPEINHPGSSIEELALVDVAMESIPRVEPKSGQPAWSLFHALGLGQVGEYCQNEGQHHINEQTMCEQIVS